MDMKRRRELLDEWKTVIPKWALLCLNVRLQDWMSTQALFIQAMFTNLSWES